MFEGHPDDPARPPVGEFWQVDDWKFRRNPALDFDPSWHHVYRLCRAFHSGGMAPGPLPDAGGFNNQCAWLMDAIDMMAAYERKTFGSDD